MKNNKLIKRFSLLAISFFCLTTTHVAAENFVEVKNDSKFAVVARIGESISECMRKGESFTFNLDEVVGRAGSSYNVLFDGDYDCPFKRESKWSTAPKCSKRKNGAQGKQTFQRTTSTGTKKFVVRSDGNKKFRCALK